MNRRPCFAYGANMNRASFEARCPSARYLTRAVLPGYRFGIARCGYATVVPDPAGAVHGVLWVISAGDEEELDAFEGMEDGLYLKTEREVRPEGGLPVEAMIYVAADPTPGRPNPGYLEDILTSADREGLPPDYRAELGRWRRTDGPAPTQA